MGVTFSYEFKHTIPDRQIRFSNGWIVKIGRGLDIYQKPASRFSIGATDTDLRPCLETVVDIFQEGY